MNYRQAISQYMSQQRLLPQCKTSFFSTPAGQELPDKAALIALCYPEFSIMSSAQNRAPPLTHRSKSRCRKIIEQVIQPLSQEKRIKQTDSVQGMRESIKQISHLPNCLHTGNPFVSFWDGVTQWNFRLFLVSIIKT